ncbi:MULTISPECIES: ABC transporter ATP-binding protein [Halobacteriovorax]|uniref:ATP-binding cassette domain-containing protein n=1 Tax=Halobacteriovorax vibrionivorans TaxID=2152716 RepID=A0ABY0IG68_9BACT|nr:MULTISPECIES: ATP-binding cassette domain-containing protein [Halobacteriovorax]AYF43501.1 ABC transporter, ATP-binding protein [Halobacteriovorax sp. BALOs_7]RZF21929.1 ATP-binding cassette domain-containing protein [Halobacteriovorax vibrionivorans]TGD47229.1 ATP-binding cassette domain-containing protein [Halobacteriovorax sp. Y22]
MLEFDDHSVRIRNLTKTFGKHTVLSELNFDIKRGSITTILGFSGAGKSTLLKHILGLHHPTSGSIEVLGKDLSTLQEDKLREFRQNYGMLFQYAALFDSMTTIENVAFPLIEFTKLNESEIKEKAASLLKSVGLQEISFDKLPSELSGGMRKRVGLARALALSPQLMLYDEPTTGLDPITTKMVNDLIIETSKLHKDIGLTSIIISHDVKASLEISDYVAFLNRGNIVEYLPANDFKNSDHPLVQEFINL